MMELIFVFVKLLDPIAFAIAFSVVLCSRKKTVIFISAAVTAIAVETILTSTQSARIWGQGLLPGFVAALLQAGLSFWIVSLFRGKNEQAVLESRERVTEE
jgi:hypothetical protein